MREIIYGFIVTFSVVVTFQSAHVLYLTMYTYNIPPSVAGAPDHFQPPRLSFTVMLPARHEESAIQTTVRPAQRRTADPGPGLRVPFPRTETEFAARRDAVRAEMDRQHANASGSRRVRCLRPGRRGSPAPARPVRRLMDS